MSDTERHSWQPIDLVALGDVSPLEASISGLAYPGGLHLIYGEPEATKSWLCLILALEEIRAGRRVVFVDLETNARLIRARLVDLGATADELERLHYIAPSEPISGKQIQTDLDALLATCAPSLIVIDALAGALALHSFDGNSNADVETFYAVTLAPFRATEAAIVLVDHVVKNREERGRWPIGAQRKLGGADVGLLIEPVSAFSRGRTGLARIRVQKDRNGALQRPYAAELELSSDADTGRITWEIRQAEREGSCEFVFKPTWYMEQVFAWLKEHGPASRNAAVDGIGRKRAFVLDAIRNLLIEGTVCETIGPNRAKLLSVVPSSEKFPEPSGTTEDLEPGNLQFPVPTTKGTGTGTVRGRGQDDIPF